MKRFLVVLFLSYSCAAYAQISGSMITFPSDNTSATTSTETTAIWRAQSGKLFFKDADTAATALEDLGGGVADHGGLTGLGDDDHTQYLNAARHTSVHNAAYNNALAISGDVGSNVTVGAHVADGALHWLRPAQIHDVSQDGTGQYATIAAALTAANAAASSSAPQVVRVFPGIYSESDLQLNAYVSIISTQTPGSWNSPTVTEIKDVTASGDPILKLAGNNIVYGLKVTASGTGEDTIQIQDTTFGVVSIVGCYITSSQTSSFYAVEILDHNVSLVDCYLLGSQNGKALYVNNATSGLNVTRCRIQRSAATSYGGYLVTMAETTNKRFTECEFVHITDTAGAGGFIKADATGEDSNFIIEQCTFRAEGALGVALDFGGAFAGIDAGANVNARVTGAYFRSNVGSGTYYDMAVRTDGEIGIANSIWSPADVATTGTLFMISEGDKAVEDLDVNSTATVTGNAIFNGAVMIEEDLTSPTIASGYGQIWVDGADTLPHFVSSGGAVYPIAGPQTLWPQIISQDAEPTLDADNTAAIWIDTNDSDRVYLIFRRGSADHVKVELQ